MKTINLKKQSPSVSELLDLARNKSLLLVSKDGATFVLEEADDFDREVAELGNSAKFMRFLKKRSKERGVTSIDQFAEEVNKAPKRRRPRSARQRRASRPSRRSAASA